MSKPPPDPLFTMHGDMEAIHSIYLRVVDEEELLIYCGTESGHVHIWNIQMLRQVKKLSVGTLPCISILHHNSHFITQEKGGEITLWKDDDNNWEKITSFDCDHKMFCKILIFDDTLVHPCSDSQVRFSRITDKRLLKIDEGIQSEIKTKSGMIMCAKFSVRHRRLLICYESGLLCSVNPNNGSIESEIIFNSECPLSFDYCDSADFGIIGFSCKDIIKFSINENKDFVKVKTTELTNAGTSSIAIRNDGIIFVVSTWDKAIRYFSAKTLKLLAVLNHHNLPIECLSFIPQINNENKEIKNNCLLAGSRDGRISLWNLYPT